MISAPVGRAEIDLVSITRAPRPSQWLRVAAHGRRGLGRRDAAGQTNLRAPGLVGRRLEPASVQGRSPIVPGTGVGRIVATGR
jgi:hypothetical protein